MFRRPAVCLSLVLAFTLACQKEAPPPAPPPLPPPTRVAPPASPPPARAAPAAPPVDDPAPFATFDRANLRQHLALLTFVKKERARWDKEAQALAGKPKAVEKIGKLQADRQKAIEVKAEELRTLDPDGTSSYLTTAHATNLQYLGDEYPSAVAGAASGDPKPLEELRAEMDKVEKKINAWLTELRKAPAAP